MLKRIIYGGIFAIVCAGLILVILLQRLDKITPIRALQAVPDDAILFIEDLDYEYLSETFLPGSRIWIDFVNTTGRNRLDSQINSVVLRISSNEQIRELLLKEGFSISLHLQGKDQLMPLFYIPYSEYHNDHEFEQMMLTLVEGEAMVNDRKYETEILYDVSGKQGLIPEKFTFACVNGICLVSPSNLLVESSVRTIHDETDQEEDPGLQLIRETAGKYVHANIYINYSRGHQLFYPFLSQEHWDLIHGISEMATWGELDLDIKEDAMVLNGMTLADSEAPLFLGAFVNQSPVRMEIHEMMPSGISYFLHLGISDRDKFMHQMETYLSGTGKWDGIETERKRLSELYGIDPFDDMFRIMKDEMAWFAIEGETAHPGEEVFILETKSHSETEEITLRWIEQYLQAHAFDMQSYLHIYQLDDQTRFNIYQLPELFYKGLIPGRLFNRYFTIFENYLIFGPSISVLSRVIYQNILQKTFTSDQVYHEMSDYFSNKSNITLFIRPFAYMDYKSELLNDRTKNRLKEMELFLRRIPGIVIQYTAEDHLLYHNISCKYTSQIREKALTVWESLLDSTAVLKPALVINHNTQEKEIFIQDASDKIYLINSTGRILWKQKLDGPIKGDVFQVDYYKNGKLQYLFNTGNKLHLIDRNGNYVERFPIILRSPATSPLALFDYDNSRDYRIFLACEDRKTYMYDIEGNLVTGWKFDKTESVVTRPAQHFRIGDKDYIVLADQNRPYFLDRRGKERIRPDRRVVFSAQNPFTLDMNIREEKPRWVSTDTSGNVICVYLDGTVSTLLEQKISSNHFFMMQDMDKDGIPEYIFADGNELRVLQQDGKRLYSYRVRDNISDMPDIYKFSASDIKIGITDRSRNRIYLINADGSLYEGFPLEGSTRFSIGYFAGSDSRFNLIVGSTNNFLYNYSIE